MWIHSLDCAQPIMGHTLKENELTPKKLPIARDSLTELGTSCHLPYSTLDFVMPELL